MELELLKVAVTRKFGRPVINRPDCEELSLEIYAEIHEHISYNTLRRFFKIADQDRHEASRSTLNILARYIGYKNYHAFCSISTEVDPLLQLQEFFLRMQFENQISIPDLNQMIASFPDRSLICTLLLSFICKAIEKNDVLFIQRFFELDDLFKNRNYLDHELYFVIQFLGIELRSKPQFAAQVWPHWAAHPIARLFYFELFVDMDFLMVSHYQALESYLSNSQNSQDKIFAKSLLCWRSIFLENELETAKYITDLEAVQLDSDTHPIPIARMYNCLLVYYHINKQKLKYNETIEKIVAEVQKRQKEFDPFFHYWIIEGLCMVQEIDLCLQIIEKIETNWSQVAQQFYNKGALNKTQIIKCRCLNNKGDGTQVKNILKKININNSFTFSRIYDQLFLPSEFNGHLNKKFEELKFKGVLKFLNQEK
jgi:hypothetical protein